MLILTRETNVEGANSTRGCDKDRHRTSYDARVEPTGAAPFLRPPEPPISLGNGDSNSTGTPKSGIGFPARSPVAESVRTSTQCQVWLDQLLPASTFEIEYAPDSSCDVLESTASRGQDVSVQVGNALRAGFRHLDTAQAYMNEDSVGEGIIHWSTDKKTSRTLSSDEKEKSSEDNDLERGVLGSRDDVWVTTKYAGGAKGPLGELKDSLDRVFLSQT